MSAGSCVLNEYIAVREHFPHFSKMPADACMITKRVIRLFPRKCQFHDEPGEPT